MDFGHFVGQNHRQARSIMFDQKLFGVAVREALMLTVQLIDPIRSLWIARHDSSPQSTKENSLPKYNTWAYRSHAAGCASMGNSLMNSSPNRNSSLCGFLQ